MKSTSDEYPKFYLYRRVVEAKLFIDSNFCAKINLGNIADEAYFSKFHFTRLFKAIYGFTPHQYLTRVRLEKSIELLQEGIPVTEVCFLVGFESCSSFTGLFKRTFKITPSVYQQQALQRKLEIGNSPLKFIPNCFQNRKAGVEKAIFKKYEDFSLPTFVFIKKSNDKKNEPRQHFCPQPG